MIEVLPQSEGSAIGFKISGKVTSEDYDFLLPKIDEAIKDFGSINLLIMMGQFEGWTDLEGAKQDFKFGKEQYRHVEKAAFVGEKKWQRWMINVIDPFTRRTDEQFFSFEQLDEAWQWISG